MTTDLANRVVTPDDTFHDYWQCPQCRSRFWTVYGREKLICTYCRSRAVPISMATYLKPNGDKSSDQAYVSVDEST